MKFKEYLGEESVKNLTQRLTEAFENEEGVFVFIATADDKGGSKVTDAYYKFCKDCVAHAVAHNLADAERSGLLAESSHEHNLEEKEAEKEKEQN